LVVPNEHVVDLMAEGSVAALTGMARTLHFTADLLKKRLDADGSVPSSPTALRPARPLHISTSTWCLGIPGTLD